MFSLVTVTCSSVSERTGGGPEVFYNEEINRQINWLCSWSFSEHDESSGISRVKARYDGTLVSSRSPLISVSPVPNQTIIYKEGVVTQ